jgi:hypothetical protein
MSFRLLRRPVETTGPRNDIGNRLQLRRISIAVIHEPVIGYLDVIAGSRWNIGGRSNLILCMGYGYARCNRLGAGFRFGIHTYVKIFSPFLKSVLLFAD